MNEPLEQRTVGEIVAGDSRAAAVFEQFGIDFCCGGRLQLVDACRQATAEPAAVVRALEALPPVADQCDDVASWPPERIIDHIVSTHHAYLRSALPAIAQHLRKLVDAHGTQHPELAHTASRFEALRGDFEQHLIKEEQVLFPYVRDLAVRRAEIGISMSPFGTVENPIRMLEREHLEAGEAMHTIRELTNGYAVPADGCATYALCMAELLRFEQDLHRHVHLENNVLFPKAVELEARTRT